MDGGGGVRDYDWLPTEITRPQPYSMGPLLRWAPLHAVPQLPAVSSVRLDLGDGVIRSCLVAPRSVQMAARAQGIRDVMMIRPKGIELVNPKLESTAARIARHQSEADRINALADEVVSELGVEA